LSAVTFDVPNAQGPKRYFGALAPEGLAHGYLFTGPSGIGKRTFARRLAQSLLCQGVKSGVLGYDGTCSSCRLFAQNAHHPDFIEHEGVLKIGDRDAPAGFHDGEDLSARDLVRHLSMQSYSGGMRVLLLADVDFATHHAANALLKVLEEPPQQSLFLLVSNAPSRVLPTILSRCRKLLLRPLATDDVVRAAAIATGIAADDPALLEAAAASEGSVGRALSLLGGDALKLQQRTAALLATLPAVDPRELHALGDALGTSDRVALAAFIDGIDRWMSERMRTGDANADLPRLARLAEVWEKITSAARDTEAYNLERKPLVFSVFSMLADATR